MKYKIILETQDCMCTVAYKVDYSSPAQALSIAKSIMSVDMGVAYEIIDIQLLGEDGEDIRSCFKPYHRWKVNSFDHYAVVGDIVDEEMYQNFLNVMPPACMRAGYLQVGEAYDHLPNGSALFLTFATERGHWTYLGHCQLGDNVHMIVDHSGVQ